MPSENNRETGARKLPLRPEETDRDREYIDAAENKRPADGQGLSRDVNETNEKTRQSDGVRQATPSPETRKFAGAGPALAEHSKDAKAVKGGRAPGAYVKE